MKVFTLHSTRREARSFAKGYMAALSAHKLTLDEWVEFTSFGFTVDIHIDGENVEGKPQAWAYNVLTDGGNRVTDTSVGCQLF